MSSLSEFQELVNGITDEELLDVAEGLLRDMVEIENMKERIREMEDKLSEGKRASFWFFTLGLDPEQVDLATNTVIGRKRFLKDQMERKKLAEEEPLAEDIEVVT